MATYRTNIVTTKDKKMIVAMNSSFYESLLNINQWNDASADLHQWTGAAEKFNIQTKDVDFGNPSRRKKIYKVYVTFKAGGYMSGVIAKYATNGSNTFSGTFDSTTYYNSTGGFDSWNGDKLDSSADWITVALKPTATLSTNNIYSFQLKFEYANAGRHSYAIASSVAGGVNVEGGVWMRLDTGASGTDGTYDGMPIYIYTGPGAGQTYRVKGYDADNANGKLVNIDQVTDDDLTDSDVIPTGYGVNTASYYDMGFIPKEFEINDISIIYREKPIK